MPRNAYVREVETTRPPTTAAIAPPAPTPETVPTTRAPRRPPSKRAEPARPRDCPATRRPMSWRYGPTRKNRGPNPPSPNSADCWARYSSRLRAKNAKGTLRLLRPNPNVVCHTRTIGLGR